MTTIDLTRPDVSPPRPPDPPAPPPPSQGWTPGRTIAVVFGSILAVIGLGLFAAGSALGIAARQQDSAGYFHTRSAPFTSTEYAVTSDALDLGADLPGRWDSTLGDFLKFRLRAHAADPSTPVFIGIARSSDVDAYLAGVARDVVVDFDTDPLLVDYEAVTGDRKPARPADQTFWAASSTGTGRQTVEWTPTGSKWTIVVMNGDAHKNVASTMDLGVHVNHLAVITGSLLVVGLLIGAGGVALIAVSIRRSKQSSHITLF
jgi:hypothetical protein